MNDGFTKKTCKTCGRVFVSESDVLIHGQRLRISSDKNLWFNCVCGSTMMILKEKASWYNPTMRMSLETASLFKKIGFVKELPYIQQSSFDIQDALQKDTTSIQEVSEKLKQNPLVTSMLFAIAQNIKSSKTGEKKPFQSIEHVVNYLGRRITGEIVLLSDINQMNLETKIFSPIEFWSHSFQVAANAEKLAKKLKLESILDTIYLGASLSNIGKIVGAFYYAQKTDLVQQLVNIGSTWDNAERQIGIPSHGLLGEIACVFWGLPEFIIQSTQHHMIPDPSVNHVDFVSIVSFAHIITHVQNKQNHRYKAEAKDRYKEIFHMSDYEIESF